MSALPGLLLVLIFLVFAALLFLERLSALLALPLMAMAFLICAVGSDVLGPGRTAELVSRQTTDDLGRRVVHLERVEGPSRFELWKQTRLRYAEWLQTRAARAVDAVAALEAELVGGADDLPARLRQRLAQIRTQEEEADRQMRAELDALPDFFARPPHYGGPRARFEDAWRAIGVTEHLRPVVALAEAGAPDAAPRLQQMLARARADSAAVARRYAAVPNAASAWFAAVSAVTYLWEYLVGVVRAGSLQLSATILATLFGGMFAMYVRNLKVAERLVYWTAEFAGERPLVISLAVFLVTAVIFTSVGGLGTVIMLGTIILPILRSVGLSPVVGAGVFLIAIATGGTLHPVARRLWMDFYGLPAAQLDSILWTMVGLYTACGVIWCWWGTRRARRTSFCAVAAERSPAAVPEVPARLMVAPFIPVALVYFGGVEEITAFTLSIVYMYVCVLRRPGSVRGLARSLIEGAQAVVPPALLMVGIGMLITALATPPVQGHLRPLLAAGVPDSRWGYILLFSAAAPLALYRGPLNVWGMGLAVSATLLATSSLPPAAILCALLAAGMLQGVCDPTNTANVWIAGFQGVSVNQILRYTLLPVWAAAIVAVVIFGFRFVGA